jgi:hypothetical protein
MTIDPRAITHEELAIFKSLEAFCNHAKTSELSEQDAPAPLEPEGLWNLVVRMAAQSPYDLFSDNFNVFMLYKHFVPSFLTTLPDPVRDIISTKGDSDLSLDRVYQNFALRTRLFPFLIAPYPAEITAAAVAVVHSYLEKNKDLPKSFLNLFRDVIVENMEVSAFDGLVDFFKAAVYSENSVVEISAKSSTGRL